MVGESGGGGGSHSPGQIVQKGVDPPAGMIVQIFQDSRLYPVDEIRNWSSRCFRKR